MVSSTSRTEEKVSDLWQWLRPKNAGFSARPSSSFEEHEELEAIIEQTEEYDNINA